MNTSLDCIPCFFKQALNAARMNNIDQASLEKLIKNIARVIPDFDLSQTPVEMAGYVHRLIREFIGTEDPYQKIKMQSNRKALKLLPKLKKKINNSKHPLRLAIEYAVAGNIIDFGANTGLDVDAELGRIIQKEERVIAKEGSDLFQFDVFYANLQASKTLLYIGDNAGEIVFDKLLIDEICKEFPKIKIYFATRGSPVINDITPEDAYYCNIDENAEVISSGIDLPGCIIEKTDPEFQRLFYESDCVISKGQGNFEALSGGTRSVFFLFMAKCKVIADAVSAEIGSILLLNKT